MTPLLLAAQLGISVIFSLPKECAHTSEFIYQGCVLPWLLDYVWINQDLEESHYRRYVISHEIGHTQCIKNQNNYTEKCAKDYAGVMMKKYNW